jgi:ankyrin repeat protein
MVGMGDSTKIMTFNQVHGLIKNGEVSSSRSELDEGLSLHFSNQSSWTLLRLAAMEGNSAIGELLIARGADLDAKNELGETALSLAAHRGHTQFIHVLLANGASPDCQPHGQNLNDWMRIASGLPQDKIASILRLINKAVVD